MFISEYAKISLDMLRIPQGLIFLHILKTVILPLGISPNSCNTCFGRRSSAQNRLYRQGAESEAFILPNAAGKLLLIISRLSDFKLATSSSFP